MKSANVVVTFTKSSLFFSSPARVVIKIFSNLSQVISALLASPGV